MPPSKRRIKRQRGSRHIALIFFLIAAAVFFFFEESGKNTRKAPPAPIEDTEEARTDPPKVTSASTGPKIAIVMDDLGPNKKTAEAVFALGAPVTLSILPHQTHSEWIANEGSRRGHQVIAHIPMEAVSPQKLGKGALLTGMSQEEIARTLGDDLRSIPHIAGVSSHMGSAFTKDDKAMRAVITVIKERGLFFLDSFTTSQSIAYKTANAMGAEALRRDVFLDNTDDIREIKAQWKRLLKISSKKGYAIALAHPRENTLFFLQKALEEKSSVRIVPLSELLSENIKSQAPNSK